MARFLVLNVVLVLEIACAVPPPTWSLVDDQSICATVGRWRFNPEQHALGVRELVRRGKVQQRHAKYIRGRQIDIGMSSCGLIASWGWTYERNQSVGSWGTHTQWVYGSYSDPTYVYTENAIVTGWQQ